MPIGSIPSMRGGIPVKIFKKIFQQRKKMLVILRDRVYCFHQIKPQSAMSTQLKTTRLAKSKCSNRPGVTKRLMRFLKMLFFVGPRQLLTSRISGKCAAAMIVMCTPSLLCSAILTVPALLFQSPQQHAYFYFSRGLEGDPCRWVAMVLAALCAILSLAMPAAMPAPKTPAEEY